MDSNVGPLPTQEAPSLCEIRGDEGFKFVSGGSSSGSLLKTWEEGPEKGSP